MIEHPLQGDLRLWARGLLEQDALFGKLQPKELDLLMTSARLQESEANERIYTEGDPSDSFFLLLAGTVGMMMPYRDLNSMFEALTLEAPHFIGINGLFSRKPRAATVYAKDRTFMLQFQEATLEKLIRGLPVFAYRLSYSLSKRLAMLTQQLSLPNAPDALLGAVNQEVLGILPVEYPQSYKVLPLGITGNILRICSSEAPSKGVIDSIRELLPGIQVHLYHAPEARISEILGKFGLATAPTTNQQTTSMGSLDLSGQSSPSMGGSGFAGGSGGFSDGNGGGGDTNKLLEALVQQTSVLQQSMAYSQTEMAPHLLGSYASGSFKKSKRHILSPQEKRKMVARILPLLQQMAQENASDLHISANQRMRWRIDGELYEIEESRLTGEEEVLEILGGMMKEENVAEFEAYNHTDFSYEIEGLARYRVNIYREDNGISAALRQIPLHIPSIKDLSLPGPVCKMAELTQGLVLVTGPTGSGKSTTLAALIREINETQRKHIITLEDPIEFVQKSDKALIHQREIGPHTPSFNAALRSALREDPDIVMVGEMRDRETMELAIETAHTGHLVFGTLHTNNVIATVDRIVDMFPSEQHNQIRGSLSEVLRGIVCQVLCKRTNRGRVGAYEVLTSNHAISNLIRSEKAHQIPSAMTGKTHLLLNQQLEELVRKRVIDKREAVTRAYDKLDMKQRLGMDVADLKSQTALIKDQMQGRGMDRLGRSDSGSSRRS